MTKARGDIQISTTCLNIHCLKITHLKKIQDITWSLYFYLKHKREEKCDDNKKYLQKREACEEDSWIQ